MIRFAIGQDSHAFETDSASCNKPLILGGYTLPDCALTLRANSDGDVLLHALTNAVSGITCRNILGAPADELCKRGITDSRAYLKLAMDDLTAMGYALTHISFTVECKKPHLSGHIDAIRKQVAEICSVDASCVGLTATTGEGLTAFGQGLGISVFCVITVARQKG